ncbi:hypothetical protein B9Z55_008827 [Caenorhabditis nigoni]|uniref:Uncharacterized protein n=1 Tax=Caenorhabditis nigoni TaxID=1611254 RepID=A0A2G5UPV6_9PELO|nr:hypothetical protein B9Z55_008827 [Caenorhabditis nigoni]
MLLFFNLPFISYFPARQIALLHRLLHLLRLLANPPYRPSPSLATSSKEARRGDEDYCRNQKRTIIYTFLSHIFL